jgi:hypothetical protein
VFGEKEFNLVVTPIHPPSRRHQGPFSAGTPERGANAQDTTLFNVDWFDRVLLQNLNWAMKNLNTKLVEHL